MTEPNAPQDPSSYDQPGGYTPPPPPPAGYPTPPANQPDYAGPPAAGVRPFSPLVGRQLSSDETLWSMLGHLGGALFAGSYLGFVPPLIVMLTKGNESPYTRYHSVEALNFQITVLIGLLVSSVLFFLIIGFLVWPLAWLFGVIFGIIGGIAANKGETYKYPFALRLVK